MPGSTTVGVAVAINGLKASDTSTTGALVTHTYDSYARPLRTTTRQHASTGDDVYEELEYYPGTTQVKHRKNLALGGNWFQQTYYDNMGRVSVERVNDSVQWKTRRFAYTARGELYRAWGSGQNPVEYQYNSYGWRTHMRLYRQTSGINWDDAYWPGSPGTADETEWGYQGRTGLVTSKTDPANATVSFTYNKRSQVATRTWARGVTTTYKYYDVNGTDPDLGIQSYRTGDLKIVDYGDSTPDVTYRFDDYASNPHWRSGQVMRIYDGTGVRYLMHRLGDLQPDWEWVDQTHYGVLSGAGRGVWRAYDTLGRPEYVRMGWGSAINEAHETQYTYDGATGRLWKVKGSRPSVGDREFAYTYHAGSNQVDVVTGTNNGFQRTTQRQSWREVIEQVETKLWGVSKAKFTYNHDWVGQYADRTIAERLAVELGYGSGLKDEYLYTSRSEVDQAQARDLSNSALITNRQRDWTYDSQGNREDETASGVASDFGVNNRNQYDLVNGNLVYTYDADGNMTGDATWWYDYDGENRLRSATRKDQLQRLLFTYDYLGRRTRKVVETGNGSGGYTVASDRRFLYDGWNLTVEIDALQLVDAGQSLSYKTEKAFTWGLDVTGTVHGGGGVGGLLAQLYPWSGGFTYPLYDANGNIHGMIDDGGGVAAAWGYSAFGEVVQSTGWASGGWCPFRFASKFYDEETQL